MKAIVLFFLFLLPITAFTQTKAAYKIGRPYEYIPAPTQYEFQDEEQDETLTIKISGAFMYFQKFDNRTLSETEREDINMYDEIHKGALLLGISKVGEKIVCFYRYWDVEVGHWYIKYREIDFDSCAFKGEEKTLLKFSETPSVLFFRYTVSKDRSKIMFYWRHHPTEFRDKLNYDVFSFFVFDTELKQLKKGRMTMPYTEYKMDPEQFIVHSDGTPYMLSRVFNDDTRSKKEKGKGKEIVANYHYEVFQIDLSLKGILRTDLRLERNLITDMYLSEAADNTIFASGFYTKKNDENRDILNVKVSEESVDGLCLFRIDDIGEVFSEKQFEIPNEIVNQYESTSKKTGNDSELSHLKMRAIVANEEDGSTVLIAEQYQYYTSTSTSTHGSRTVENSTEHYRFDDMIICKISSDNEILWIKKLPKRQVGGNSEDLGFSYQKINNNHYLIFLDNVNNIDLPMNQKPDVHVSGKGGYLTYYKVLDKSGAVSKHAVFATKKITGNGQTYPLYHFRPHEVIKTLDNTFMMEFYKKSEEDVMIQVKVE